MQRTIHRGNRDAAPRATGGDRAAGATGPPVEIGLLVFGRMDELHRTAVRGARLALRERLAAALPGFDFRVGLVERRDLRTPTLRVAPVDLLDAAIDERDARAWDFTIALTQLELVTYEQPFALGAPSRALSAAALSTGLLDEDLEAEPREVALRRLTDRVVALALHLLGHLAGLEHTDDPTGYMHPIGSPPELDARTGFAPESLAALAEGLARAADPRLEETRRGVSAATFFLLVAWHNRLELFGSVSEMRPWRLPLRFGRLTAAASSALLVLLVTAEVWELATGQTPASTLALGMAAVLATTRAVLVRQKLTVRRRAKRLTEQVVVSDLSTSLAVLLGVLTTYALLFASAFALTAVVFRDDTVAAWTGVASLSPGTRATVAAFVASLGLAVGALGAAFEPRGFARHAAYVDEET